MIFPIFFFELISSTADLFDYKILMLDRPYYDSFQELNIFSTNNIIQGNLSILILWKQEVKHYLRRKSSDNLSEILKCLLCDKLFHFAELRCIIFFFLHFHFLHFDKVPRTALLFLFDVGFFFFLHKIRESDKELNMTNLIASIIVYYALNYNHN